MVVITETVFERSLKGDFGGDNQVKAKACKTLGIEFEDLHKPEVVRKIRREVGWLSKRDIELLATFGGTD